MPYALHAKTAEALVEGAQMRSSDWTVSGNDMYSVPSGNVGIGSSTPESKVHIKGSTFPVNIESSGAKYILFTKGTQSVASNKLGWIGFSGDNKRMVIRNAQGNQMTFESKNIFNISVQSSAGAPGNVNFIFDNDGNVRFYNKSMTGDHPRVGIGVLNSATPSERLEVDGGIKIGSTIEPSNPEAGMIQWDGSDFLGYDGTQWVSLSAGNIAGATGPTGAQGATGAAGSNGADGATGAQGATGATGAAGSNGAVGPQDLKDQQVPQELMAQMVPLERKAQQGLLVRQEVMVLSDQQDLKDQQVPQEVMAQMVPRERKVQQGLLVRRQCWCSRTNRTRRTNRCAGSNGADGATGAQGATGATGAAGSAGAVGPTGPEGPTGAAGSNGATGAQGATGLLVRRK